MGTKSVDIRVRETDKEYERCGVWNENSSLKMIYFDWFFEKLKYTYSKIDY